MLRAKVMAPFLVLAIFVITKLWAGSTPLGVWLVIPAAALLVASEVFAEAHLSVAVFYFSSTRQMVAAVLAGAVGLCVLFTAADVPTLPTPWTDAVQPALTGFLVGILVRDAFVACCKRRRTGHATYRVRLYLACSAGLIVLLFPATQFQSGAGSPYVAGIGVGFLIHFLARRADQRHRRRQRWTHQILRKIEAEKMKRTAAELAAAELFARRRWPRLKRLLQEHEAEMSLGLRIIKATSERVGGDNAQAVRTLLDELDQPGRTMTHIDHLAYLLIAICYRDLGRRGAMRSGLLEAETRRPKCGLVLFWKALTQIEDLPDPGTREWGPAEARRTDAARCLQQAQRLVERARPETVFSAIVACSVPLTRRLMDDTAGLLLYKSAMFAPAQALFEACVQEDSHSASSYLHYGQLHQGMLAVARHYGDGLNELAAAREFCLRMSVALSGDHDTYTRRRARELLLLDDASLRQGPPLEDV